MEKKTYVEKLSKYARTTRSELKYEEVRSEGPEHNKPIILRAVINGQGFPIGVGKNTEEAREDAAKNTLRSLKEKENPRPVTGTASENPTARVPQKSVTKPISVNVQKNSVPRNVLGPASLGRDNVTLYMVGDGDNPVASGKTKRKAKEEAAREICGSEATALPSWSAVSDNNAPATLPTPPSTLESLDAKSVATTTSDSIVYINSTNPDKDQDDLILEEMNTGNSPGEMTLTQLEIARFTSTFDSIGYLGKGAFGQVFKAKEKLTEKDYAVKIVRCKEIRKALREVKALSDLQHCNIVRYYTCWLEELGHQCESADGSCSSSQSSTDNSSVKYLYIQMELCDTKTLKVWIDEKNIHNVKKSLRKTSDESGTIFLQIVSGVEYIHSKMLIHRDLKPANIMFGLDGEVKIGDFGLVTAENDDDDEVIERTVYKGTPSYMAPEQRSQKSYDRKVDIFALGLIYFELLWRVSSVHEKSKVWDGIRGQKFPQEFPGNFPHQYFMIRPMLCVKPEDRPEASDLKTDLEECTRRLNTQKIKRRGSKTV